VRTIPNRVSLMTMSSYTAPSTSRSARYSDPHVIKAEGATYTPAALATFVAEEMLRVAQLPPDGEIWILDPAAGDGQLLIALLGQLSVLDRRRSIVVGFDTDSEALNECASRLRDLFPECRHVFDSRDFLSSPPERRYDLVIANPPYVRTQIIGSSQAQDLAARYGLTGRVDLYYAFVLAIADVLGPTATAGLITSNRFMTTRSGQAVRASFLSRFRLRSVFDLGDTKLFEAAVLPAVTVAQGLSGVQTERIPFASIYSTDQQCADAAQSVLDALRNGNSGLVKVDDRCFDVRRGVVDHGSTLEGVWRVANESSDDWLRTVERNTWNTFRHIGKIRVGVKTTADKVFIRSDWESIQGGEPELLQRLITRHCAGRFKAQPPQLRKHLKRILYPHTIDEAGRRTTYNLSSYPRTRTYLERYRSELESRQYVIDAGRKWYEIWVPQDPSAWTSPKLVFLDISEKPTFWIELDGGVVNGECYFLRNERGSADDDLLWLAMAVANSSFIETFYDHRFNNKLYAGRRRFITQYVEHFPLPDPEAPLSRRIIESAKLLYEQTPKPDAEKALDRLVWEAFGHSPKS